MEGQPPKSCKHFMPDTKVPARPHPPKSKSVEQIVLLCVPLVRVAGEVMRAWATAADQYADPHGDHGLGLTGSGERLGIADSGASRSGSD